MDFGYQLSENVDACEAPLSFDLVTVFVIIACVLGLAWAAFNFMLVKKIDVENGIDGESESFIKDISETQRKLLLELG